jgi:hypothetical protein
VPVVPVVGVVSVLAMLPAIAVAENIPSAIRAPKPRIVRTRLTRPPPCRWVCRMSQDHRRRTGEP